MLLGAMPQLVKRCSIPYGLIIKNYLDLYACTTIKGTACVVHRLFVTICPYGFLVGEIITLSLLPLILRPVRTCTCILDIYFINKYQRHILHILYVSANISKPLEFTL